MQLVALTASRATSRSSRHRSGVGWYADSSIKHVSKNLDQQGIIDAFLVGVESKVSREKASMPSA